MGTHHTAGTYIELDDAWSDPGWTRVPNSIVRCNTISRRVKGWILEVASHAPGRRLSFAEMLTCSTDGRDATYATIKEAVEAGFVTRRQERDETGRLGVVVYRLHVSQQNPRSAPLPDFPYTAAPDTAKPETKREKTKDLEHQTGEDSIQQSSVPSPSSLRADGFQDQNIASTEHSPSPRQRVAGPCSNQDPKIPKTQDRKPNDHKPGSKDQKTARKSEGRAVSSAPYPAAVLKAKPTPRPQPIDWDEPWAVEKKERLVARVETVTGELSSRQLDAVVSMIEQGMRWQKIANAVERQRRLGVLT